MVNGPLTIRWQTSLSHERIANMSVVYTIGYEGTDIDRVVATLRSFGVNMLADVRAVALSRKKGFSKTALQVRLESEGIGYSHFVELGDPKSGREAARAGHFGVFQRIYSQHLSNEAAKASLGSLAELAHEQTVCLLCYERDPRHCHRSIVANRLEAAGLRSIDLFGDLSRRHDHHTAELPRRYIGKGIAAAE
jgi:uncharacterized protein (DUF488 family)